MKTDRVLTIDEYLNEICLVPKHVKPPTPEARHISTVEENPGAGEAEQGCRCDRWGHPCPGCLEHKLQTHAALPDSPLASEVERSLSAA